jgi:hypothetical protein
METEAFPRLDHLLFGIADLDRGITWMQEKTGVKATIGGTHPGLGTRNALISLGNLQYIEIISLDPMQKRLGPTAARVHDLTAPQLITWAASTRDIDALCQQAQAAGYEIEGPIPGQRMKPDGTMLKWKTAKLITSLGDMVPFFIEWENGVTHPSQDSATGCKLEVFEVEHPQADQVRKMLSVFGMKETIAPSSESRLKAILSTPKGRIEL